MSRPISELVRVACARVASQARSVYTKETVIEAYARGLPIAAEVAPPDRATHFAEGGREGRAAFAICLNAINYGSGWWLEIRKRPGYSGYFTIAAASPSASDQLDRGQLLS